MDSACLLHVALKTMPQILYKFNSQENAALHIIGTNFGHMGRPCILSILLNIIVHTVLCVC